MRTMKALLVTAAIGSVGIATSMADPVYSANVVGFVNLNLHSGYNMVANPLNASPTNMITTVLANVPDFTTYIPWDETAQAFGGAATYLGGWDIDYPMAPGGGAFLYVDSATTVTFVGEVPQGTLVNPIVANYQMRSSIVPQAGSLSDDLGFVGQDFDTFIPWDANAQAYGGASTFLGGWDIPPMISIGQAFFLYRDPANVGPSWTRTFTVQ